MSQRKQKLNVAMIGSGFIARVHSNAFHQVGYFFKLPYDLHLKVICGRDRAKLEAAFGWRASLSQAVADVLGRIVGKSTDSRVGCRLKSPLVP